MSGKLSSNEQSRPALVESPNELGDDNDNNIAYHKTSIHSSSQKLEDSDNELDFSDT